MKKLTNAELQRKIVELESQLAFAYARASEQVKKASSDNLMASGAIVTITALGGRVIMSPICIRDGLSHDTIKALQADILNSYNLATLSKPKV